MTMFGGHIGAIVELPMVQGIIVQANLRCFLLNKDLLSWCGLRRLQKGLQRDFENPSRTLYF